MSGLKQQFNILIYMYIYITIWLFNIAMENVPFIDGLPINSMVIFHGYVSHNQRVIDYDVTITFKFDRCLETCSL
jgi:hypothetical protein